MVQKFWFVCHGNGVTCLGVTWLCIHLYLFDLSVYVAMWYEVVNLHSSYGKYSSPYLRYHYHLKYTFN